MPGRLPVLLSLQESVAYWGQYQPQKAALVSDTVSLSYAEVLRHVIQLRSQLRDLSLDRQAGIGLCFSSKIPLLLSLSAVLSEGHTAVILNPNVGPDTLASMIRDGNCPAVMTDRPPGQATSEWDHCATLFVPKITLITDEGTARQRLLEPVVRYADDTWGIIYSSGTTGRPKGIVRTDFSILMELVGWCLELSIMRSSTVYIGRPVYYTGGLVLAASTLLAGGTVLLPEEHSIEGYLGWMESWSVDLAFLIPDQVRPLVAIAKERPRTLPAPRVLLTMGAPIDVSTKVAIRELLRCKYQESWGNSEGLGTITDPDDLTFRPQSVGRPFLTDRMTVLRDDGSPAETGEVGRLAGHADSLLSEYKNREDLNAALIRGDLVLSEDLGYRDSMGYYYLAGRVTERIVRRGIPIFARDLEETLLQVPGVAEVVVVGLDDPDEGQVPAALIVLNNFGDFVDRPLLPALNNALSELQRLRTAVVVPVLPRNSSGKIDAASVRALLTNALGKAKDARTGTLAPGS